MRFSFCYFGSFLLCLLYGNMNTLLLLPLLESAYTVMSIQTERNTKCGKSRPFLLASVSSLIFRLYYFHRLALLFCFAFLCSEAYQKICHRFVLCISIKPPLSLCYRHCHYHHRSPPVSRTAAIEQQRNPILKSCFILISKQFENNMG